jgi:iron-sulfur cluster repair protein YtfE (RIC family)
MELDDVRRELMADHAHLRELISRLERHAATIQRGEGSVDDARTLRELLRTLFDDLEAHSGRENEILEPILRSLDAWGPARVERMEEEHRAEHEALVRTLEQLTEASLPGEMAATAVTLCEELLVHMAVEEEYLLHPNVLTYDVVKPGQSTG